MNPKLAIRIADTFWFYAGNNTQIEYIDDELREYNEKFGFPLRRRYHLNQGLLRALVSFFERIGP